ncbi:MAG: hypothetical protein BIFFINMI_04391 [Phycisphaerae bacterium]|nr:hypothetical protein [Phycisphaerae bacterium]
MSLKRWLSVVAASVLVVAWAVPVLAEGEEGVAPKPHKQKDGAGNAKAPKAPKAMPLGAGTPLAGAFNKMELNEETKTKVSDALKAWKDKSMEEAKALKDKRTALQTQIKEEKDEAKKKQLLADMKALTAPSEKDQFESAKTAVKGLLNEEQLKQLDEGAKNAQTEMALKGFDMQIGMLSKKGVELSDEQKTKVEAVKTKLTADLGALNAGQNMEARGLVQKAGAEIKKDVLTDEQRTKLGAAGEGHKNAGEGQPKAPRENKHKDNGAGEGGAGGEEGGM